MTLEVPRVHPLKTDKAPFEPLFLGWKTAEFRKDDRGFKLGDQLHLREVDERKIPTGRTVIAQITHIQTGYGIPHGYCMLSFRRLRIYFSPDDFASV